MEVIHKRCVGMDVSKTDAKVCIRVQGAGTRRTSTEVSTWSSRSSSIEQLGQALCQAKVSIVVMEATGDYWKPFYYLLSEAGLNVVLANPRQVRQIPGRKTDVADAVWLADLAAHGLVKGSFVPEAEHREVKDLVRCRTILTRSRVQAIQRLEKLLESAAVKLSSVVSDICGVSGRKMLQALIDGERDPHTLAQLGSPRLKANPEVLAEALTGRFSDHHAFLAKIHLSIIDDLSTRIKELDQRIDSYFTNTNNPSSNTDGQQGHTPTLTWGQARNLLTTIPGISERGAEQILAEIGTDMRVFKTAKQLASWAGVAPGLKQSAGKQHPSQCPHGDTYLKAVLGIAAQSAANTKNTFFAARYKRLRRRGSSRALVAVARSMITAIWHILNTGQPYHDLGGDYYTKRRPGTAISAAFNRLRQAGCTITNTPQGILITQNTV